jgi:hypothetical protein
MMLIGGEYFEPDPIHSLRFFSLQLLLHVPDAFFKPRKKSSFLFLLLIILFILISTSPITSRPGCFLQTWYLLQDPLTMIDLNYVAFFLFPSSDARSHLRKRRKYLSTVGRIYRKQQVLACLMRTSERELVQ